MAQAYFVEVSKFYLNVSDVACQVKLPRNTEPGGRISIARVGWKSSSEYHTQVSLDESAQGRDGVRIVIFPSAALPTDKHQYQFVYVDTSGEARVSSEPFAFAETSPDDSLSSYELIDESRTTDSPESRRFQAGSVGKTFEVGVGNGNSPCGSLATSAQNIDDVTVEKTPNDDEDDEDDDKSSPPPEIHPTSSLSSSSDDEDEEVDDKEAARLLEENAKCLASSSSSSSSTSCDSSDDSDDSHDGGGDDEKDVARVSEENVKLKGRVSILTEQVTTLNGQLTGFVDSVSRGDEFNRIRKLWKSEKLAYEKAEKRNSELSEELQKALKENAELKEKMESFINRIELLEKERTEEIEPLKKKLEMSEDQVLNLTEKLEEAQNELKEKHEECTDLCRKVGEMEGQHAILDEKIELRDIQTKVLFSKAMGKEISLPPMKRKQCAGDEPTQLQSPSLEFQDITIATPPSYHCPGGDLSLGEVSLLKSEKRREKTKKGDKDRRHHRRHRHQRRDDDSSIGGVEREEKRKQRRRRKKSTTLPSAPPDDDNEELPSRCPVCEKPYAANLDGVSRRRHCEEHFEAR